MNCNKCKKNQNVLITYNENGSIHLVNCAICGNRIILKQREDLRQ